MPTPAPPGSQPGFVAPGPATHAPAEQPAIPETELAPPAPPGSQPGFVAPGPATQGAFTVAKPLLPQLAEIGYTPRDITYLALSHYHGDHAGGNVPFSQAGSTVIAQDNVRKRLESGGAAGNGGSIKMDVKPAEKAALPIITFEDSVTFHMNGYTELAFHVAPAHTDGDAIVRFVEANVIHMGDCFFNGRYPVIGSWVIGHEEGNAAGGMGIRESDTPITGNTSRFVPHLFD